VSRGGLLSLRGGVLDLRRGDRFLEFGCQLSVEGGDLALSLLGDLSRSGRKVLGLMISTDMIYEPSHDVVNEKPDFESGMNRGIKKAGWKTAIAYSDLCEERGRADGRYDSPAPILVTSPSPLKVSVSINDYIQQTKTYRAGNTCAAKENHQ